MTARLTRGVRPQPPAPRPAALAIRRFEEGATGTRRDESVRRHPGRVAGDRGRPERAHVTRS
ncbi:hypothetical protein ACWERY_21645 [Streptomyces sp. NPDC004082]|uniref:hypothetical protein n=1 Tax=Streptomyces sp. NPDC005481 TaxID=3154881 RepID=UPI0033B0CFBB